MSQPTGYGSNNPFAPGGGQQQQQQQQPSPQPTPSFLPVPVIQQQAPAPQPVQPQVTARPFSAPKKDDGQHTQLANLIGRGREDGLDTFGNSGNLRKSPLLHSIVDLMSVGIPVGTGFHPSNRVAVQKTGFGANNPFGQAQNQQQQQSKQSDQPFFSI